jgi:hypothetical protein
LVLAFLFLGLLAARLCHIGIVWVEEAYPTAAAIQLLDGKLLYRDIWFDKPPLAAYTYLLWDARSGVPLRIAGAIFVFLCCWMAWRFAREMWSPREGMAAGCFVAFFLTFGIPSAVMALAPDLLMVLPHFAAVYLAWPSFPQRINSRRRDAGESQSRVCPGGVRLVDMAFLAAIAGRVRASQPGRAGDFWKSLYSGSLEMGRIVFETDIRVLSRIHPHLELGRLPLRPDSCGGVCVLERETMADGRLAAAGLVGSVRRLAIFPALLLPIAARNGIAGRARLYLAGTMPYYRLAAVADSICSLRSTIRHASVGSRSASRAAVERHRHEPGQPCRLGKARARRYVAGMGLPSGHFRLHANASGHAVSGFAAVDRRAGGSAPDQLPGNRAGMGRGESKRAVEDGSNFYRGWPRAIQSRASNFELSRLAGMAVRLSGSRKNPRDGYL